MQWLKREKRGCEISPHVHHLQLQLQHLHLTRTEYRHRITTPFIDFELNASGKHQGGHHAHPRLLQDGRHRRILLPVPHQTSTPYLATVVILTRIRTIFLSFTSMVSVGNSPPEVEVTPRNGITGLEKHDCFSCKSPPRQQAEVSSCKRRKGLSTRYKRKLRTIYRSPTSRLGVRYPVQSKARTEPRQYIASAFAISSLRIRFSIYGRYSLSLLNVFFVVSFSSAYIVNFPTIHKFCTRRNMHCAFWCIKWR